MLRRPRSILVTCLYLAFVTIAIFSALSQSEEENNSSVSDSSSECVYDSQFWLVMALDCSSSVDEESWSQGVQFSKNLSKEVYESYHRRAVFSVVFFNTGNWVDVKLNHSSGNLTLVIEALNSARCNDVDELNDEINIYEQVDDSHETHQMLPIVITNGVNGTDEFQNQYDTMGKLIDQVFRYATQAFPIYFTRHEITAIGVGDNVNRERLKEIARRKAFAINDFENTKWLIDFIIQENRNSDFSFSPYRGPQVGGTYVFLRLWSHCKSQVTSIRCKFGDVESPAAEVSDTTSDYICVTPPMLNTFGPQTLDFTLELDDNEGRNFTLYSNRQFVIEEFVLYPDHDLQVHSTKDGNEVNVHVQWPNDDLDTESQVDLFLIAIRESGDVLQEQLLASNVDNSGNWSGVFNTTLFETSDIWYFIQIREARQQLREYSGISVRWTNFYNFRDKTSPIRNAQQKCSEWLLSETDLSWYDTIRETRCPLAAPEGDRNWSKASKALGTGGPIHCYHTQPARNGARPKCCYTRSLDSEGEVLIADPKLGAGHAERESLPLLHYQKDVLPRMWCCEDRLDSQHCQQYYEKRPIPKPETERTGGVERYLQDFHQQPRPRQGRAFGFGDPHFITLDNLQYTFNGRGEFIVVRSLLTSPRKIKFEIQARLDAMTESEGATIITALAVGYGCSNMKYTAGQRITVYSTDAEEGPLLKVFANGQHLYNNSTNHSTLQYFCSKVKVITVSQSPTGVTIDGPGVTLSIALHRHGMSYFIQIADGFQGNVQGLSGNWNGILDDDLQPNDFTHAEPIPISSTLEEIHYQFGNTWFVPPERSLFGNLPADQEPHTRNNPALDKSFKPAFGILQMDDELKKQVDEICGNSFACRFDAGVTGDLELAAETLEMERDARDIKPNVLSLDILLNNEIPRKRPTDVSTTRPTNRTEIPTNTFTANSTDASAERPKNIPKERPPNIPSDRTSNKPKETPTGMPKETLTSMSKTILTNTPKETSTSMSSESRSNIDNDNFEDAATGETPCNELTAVALKNCLLWHTWKQHPTKPR